MLIRTWSIESHLRILISFGMLVTFLVSFSSFLCCRTLIDIAQCRNLMRHWIVFWSETQSASWKEIPQRERVFLSWSFFIRSSIAYSSLHLQVNWDISMSNFGIFVGKSFNRRRFIVTSLHRVMETITFQIFKVPIIVIRKRWACPMLIILPLNNWSFCSSYVETVILAQFVFARA